MSNRRHASTLRPTCAGGPSTALAGQLDLSAALRCCCRPRKPQPSHHQPPPMGCRRWRTFACWSCALSAAAGHSVLARRGHLCVPTADAPHFAQASLQSPWGGFRRGRLAMYCCGGPCSHENWCRKACHQKWLLFIKNYSVFARLNTQNSFSILFMMVENINLFQSTKVFKKISEYFGNIHFLFNIFFRFSIIESKGK